MRPNRCQLSACHAAIAEVLGETSANSVVAATQIVNLPTKVPSGPRDAAQLAAELRPFAELYRELLHHTDRETALTISRRAIIDSGRVSHATAAETQAPGLNPNEPLVLTSPPPAGFQADPTALSASFSIAMQFFSCEGELLSYTPDLLRFKITSCNWCAAMHAEGTPELIPFFCETDERFMDGHPTHRLIRPTAIGLGDECCDFQFVRQT